MAHPPASSPSGDTSVPTPGDEACGRSGDRVRGRLSGRVHPPLRLGSPLVHGIEGLVHLQDRVGVLIALGAEHGERLIREPRYRRDHRARTIAIRLISYVRFLIGKEV